MSAVNVIHSMMPFLYAYTFIVGFSALLVSTDWVMRRPLERETGKQNCSTLFLYNVHKEKILQKGHLLETHLTATSLNNETN